MIEMSLSDTAQAVGGRYIGADVSYRGCSIDSRSVGRGQLFVALRGPTHDGHDFVADAVNNAAVAAMVDAPIDDTACVVVADTRLALGRLAGNWRRRYSAKIVAITGSNGKTTVREMLAAILRTQGAVLSTQKNFNNDIGLPLTLFGLNDEHDFAVLEMGANHAGEIAALSEMALPDVAVITQVAPAHLQGFGDVQGVAKAKGEIIDGLAADGVAILNIDDDFYCSFRRRASHRTVIGFGLSQEAEVSASAVELGRGIDFTLRTPAGSASVSLKLSGRHNVCNALAAAAAAHALGVGPEQIAAGLGLVQPVGGRLEPKRAHSGALILDDTYNANPASLQAALSALQQYPGKRWLVLGDMGELGEGAAEFHRRAGRQAREHGIERMFGLGELAQFAVMEFGSGGKLCGDIDELIDVVGSELDRVCVVLIKGSRSMRLERLVSGLGA